MEKQHSPLSSYFLPQKNQRSSALNNTKTLILRIIKDAGIISRKELSQYSQLTQASITNITRELLAAGLIYENGYVDGDSGRKMIGLSIVTDRFCTIGLRITPQYMAVGLYDINSVCLDVKKAYIDTFHDIYFSLLELKKQIRNFIQLGESKNLTPLAISMSLLGNFRLTEKECIMLESSGKYIDLSSTLKRDFHLPVYFDSAANYGIYWLSCQRNLNYLHNKTVININVSYNIDIAIMQDRTILKNAIRLPGAFGNTLVTDCNGKQVTLQDSITTQALLDKAKEIVVNYPDSSLYEKDVLISRDLINAFYIADEVALEIFQYAADILGYTIVQLISLLHPHCIFIGDELPSSETFLYMLTDAVHAHLPHRNDYFPNIRMLPVERVTQKDNTIIGGCLYATNKILQDIEWVNSIKPVI
ncbi:ROK family transcriptional regulator [Mediterraneibacter massiliensis]|uniref:ROK family transcriptional regulator n=1 Tax=Mediterraneibacter massiliensis TaxID=1720300 RepID=UPI0024AD36AA|nr:ROK family transcriptional regulator [Mediterraneibacter massiliensis]